MPGNDTSKKQGLGEAPSPQGMFHPGDVERLNLGKWRKKSCITIKENQKHWWYLAIQLIFYIDLKYCDLTKYTYLF